MGKKLYLLVPPTKNIQDNLKYEQIDFIAVYYSMLLAFKLLITAIFYFLPYPQYICENHFQRLSKTSMFTGLKAVNHFGRPDMSSFLKFVQKKHSYVSISYIIKIIIQNKKN